MIGSRGFLGPGQPWLEMKKEQTVFRDWTVRFFGSARCPGRFLGPAWLAEDPRVSKSNKIHVAIFRFFFINLKSVCVRVCLSLSI